MMFLKRSVNLFMCLATNFLCNTASALKCQYQANTCNESIRHYSMIVESLKIMFSILLQCHDILNEHKKKQKENSRSFTCLWMDRLL